MVKSTRPRSIRLLFGVLILTGLPANRATVAQNPGPIQLRDATDESGITFRHTDGSSGRRYIVEYVSAGLALFDYNNDGLVDIYFLNGSPLPGTQVAAPPTNALYRNDGNLHFTDVTVEARVGDTGFGLGVTAADYDNDGDADLYLNNFGPNVLYRNNGNGTFTDIAEQAGVQGTNQVGAGTCFLDIDRDGDLDLYAANYIRFSFDSHRPHLMMGLPAYPSPLDYDPDPDRLYRNEGNGKFTDISDSSGIGTHAGTGMGMICFDYDQDGDTDVFVGNDVMGNFVFQNDGTGKFTEVGLFSGTAFDIAGKPQGSMGLACGDYDNDGLIDLFVTSYDRELATLYRNLGNGFFEDTTRLAGVGNRTHPHVTWGNAFVDFDNDGDRDLFIACGHLEDNIDQRRDTTSYLTENILMMNAGNGKFVDASATSGDGMHVKQSSRGAGFDDLDNDGDVDVVILNSRQGPTILANESQNDHHWLQLRLRGVKTNRDGVGTRVKVIAGDLVQVQEVHSGCAYQSHHGLRLHFGLAEHSHVDRIEIQWLGGEAETLTGLDVDQLHTIEEDVSPSTEKPQNAASSSISAGTNGSE